MEEALTVSVFIVSSCGLLAGEDASLYSGEEHGEELLVSSSSRVAFFIRRRAFANQVDTYKSNHNNYNYCEGNVTLVRPINSIELFAHV